MKYIIALVFLVVLAGQGLAQEDKATLQIDGMLDGFLGAGLGTEAVTPEQLAAIDDKVFRYAYDPSVTAELQELWASGMVQNGATQEEANKQVALYTPEFMQEWADSVFVNTGFQTNNIADVMAMKIILNLVIAQQLKDGTPYEGDIAVRDVLAVSSANTDTYKSFTDREKQYFVETTLLSLIFNVGTYFNAVQNGGDVKALVEKAHYDLISSGLDSRMVMITENGITLTNLMDKILDDTMTTEEAFPKEFIFDVLGTEPIPSEIFDPSLNTETGTETSTDITNTEESSPPSDTESNPLGQAQIPPNPLAAIKEESPFIGKFSGDGLTLILMASATGFSGELDFNGQIFPVEATGTIPTLEGTFGDGASQFPFKATLISANLNFDSQGNVFNLIRENANPLGN